MACPTSRAAHPHGASHAAGRQSKGRVTIGMAANHASSRKPWTSRAVLFVAAAVLVIAAGWALRALATNPARYNRATAAVGMEELLGRYEWLGYRLDKWQHSAVATVAPPRFRDLGAYPVGNGQAFGILGPHWPLATITNLIGPSYQKRQGFFGSLTPWLMVANKPADCPEQSIQWLADAPVVVCTQNMPGGLSLTTYTFAVPGAPVLGIVAAVVNSSSHTFRDVALMLSTTMASGELVKDRLVFDRGGSRMTIGVLGGRPSGLVEAQPPMPERIDRKVNPFSAGGGLAIRFPLGTFGPGQSVAKLGYILFSKSAAEEEQWLQRLCQEGFTVLESTRSAWQNHTGALATVATDSARLDQFFKAALYVVLSQQAAGGWAGQEWNKTASQAGGFVGLPQQVGGGFSPMHGYTYLWVRDSNGPVRFLCAVGDLQAVAAHLEYHFRACAQEKRVGNNMPLDLPLSQSVVQPDWDKVAVEPAEVPSFVILQHFWYYRSSGDLTLIRWHWPMLRRCLLGQEIDARGALPFHGDETYRFPGYELFRAGEDISDWVCLETMSADSAFEYVAAAEAMAELASALGKSAEAADYRGRAARIRQATERLYWQTDKGFYAPALSDFAEQVHRYPFASINLNPLWVGYGRPEDPRQAANVLATIKHLARPGGLVKSTPGCGYYVGMLPGYLLYNLAELRHPATAQALEGLLNSAEPSGGYAEMNTPEDRPADRVWGMHRARPWETGINAEAVLHALTGYQPNAASQHAYLRPLLLGGPRLSVKGLPLGASALDLDVSESKGVRHYIIRASGAVPNRATVDLAVVAWGSGLHVRSVQVRNNAPVRVERGPSWPWAEEIVLRNMPVDAENAIRVTVGYLPSSHRPPWFSAQPFRYGAASPPPHGTSAVVITGSAQQFRAVAAKTPRAWPMDTKIPWPAEYLRSVLLTGGRPSVPMVVLDVDRYPGAFKRPDFWTTGPGAKALKDFQAAGGKIQRVAKPSPPPRSRLGFAGTSD